ncbi:NitT/TauT family transport system substrate-binding protein [Azospirillum agricola]|uniref:ABC transporter substrate-binding protein n=1 Tax=Azospirillum agricola TaxID=1720247 RepID=UPI001AE9A762|nr:NrtA/SsuA/CpmA family ABC transporter substrate-binding protein [Azospirillum agricola]MBP2229208.1 NitT/TauT family transport system substrate-binding protein [Azospirillum agricola]
MTAPPSTRRPPVLRRLRALAGALLTASGLLAAGPPAVAAEDIAIGEGIHISWGPLIVADQQKLWQREGLTPTVIPFASGRLVLDAVAGGRVLIGTASETPVALAALAGLPIRIIATVNGMEPFELAAVKEVGSIRDLKGRRIAFAQGTNAQYYLHKLLDAAGLTLADIAPISMNPPEMVTSLANGSIDGFVWGEPHLSQALKLGPDRFHVIRTPGLYKSFASIIALQSTIDQKPELLAKALRALTAASQSIARDPEAAIALISERIKLDPEVARRIWPTLDFRVTLERDDLIRELDRQGRWAVASGLARPDAAVPDFAAVVVPGPLRAARAP